MRIISGHFKGRKLIQSNSPLTRPLKDLTKESIFNILEHSNLINLNLKKSKVLDLFAGVGSFGLECISRGAESVLFCENFPQTLNILKKNILNFNCQKKTEILNKNIFEIENLKQLQKIKFDIIFLDPPYKEKKLINLLDQIISLELLKKNGIMIIHRHKKEKEIYTSKFKILKIKSYGVSKIIFGN